MAKRNSSSTLAVFVSLMAFACQERALDFESQWTASGGKVGHSSLGSGGAVASSTVANGGTEVTALPPRSSANSAQAGTAGTAAELVPACVPDRPLSAQEVESMAWAECNVWAVEPQPLDAVACVYELSLNSSAGNYTLDPARMTPLLHSSDGRMVVLGNNASTGSECSNGFHFSGSNAIQLNAAACDRVVTGQAVVQLVFGCTPGELTDIDLD